MSTTPDDRIILTSGYRAAMAAYEMACRGRGCAELQAAVDEISAEVCGAFRPAPLPSMSSALAARRAIFGPHEAEVAA